ncbi:hypothetical protein EJ08DRAFT_521656 [Tothia fuscella]|uniref:Uncharacterized protein n=1 Tax=Tothia fuscella TaxID=1048955 RepID=A0A9P4NH28_9PEZI|nr:hypothetical protein EJ08DRAFT_521656 [Tothia fuscella]
MRFSTCITALLPIIALTANAQNPSVSHTTSVSTLTSTRTVLRVFTETHTGSPNATAAGNHYSWSKNATATAAATGSLSSPKPAAYSPVSTGAAMRTSFNVALAAIAGAAVYVVL